MTNQSATSTDSIISQRQTEIKYAVIAVGVLAAMLALSQTAPVTLIERALTDLLQSALGWGVIGVFVGAFVANGTFLVHVPYTAMMLVVAATYGTVTDQVLLGVACGLGAGLGEAASYFIVYKLARTVASPQSSKLIDRLNHIMNNHPLLTPVVVFLGALTPLPDDVMLIPLAISNYPLRRLLLPLLSGKVLHSVSLILLMDIIAYGPVEIGMQLTLGVVVLALVFSLYQWEKSRA